MSVIMTRPVDMTRPCEHDRDGQQEEKNEKKLRRKRRKNKKKWTQ